MDNPVTHRELEAFRELMESENSRLKEENDRQNHRIGILEESVREISNLAASTEKLAANMENMLKVRSSRANVWSKSRAGMVRNGVKRWHTSEPPFWEPSLLLYLRR